MKKLLLFILLTLLPLLASAETVEIDGIWYNLVPKAKEAEVTWNPNNDMWSGSYSGNIEFPTSVTYNNIKYSVTSIGESAFFRCRALTSVNIPNSVISIGISAFSECGKLTSISIPNSVTSIGDCAFFGCNSLSSITIPNSVTTIGYSAFVNCNNLISITIPNSVSSLGSFAFQGCSGLSTVTLSNCLKTIGDNFFEDCTALTTVKIPNSVTSIGYGAFSGCKSLTTITIPNSVTSIGSYAFQNCSGLTSITLPNSVTSIYGQAFYGCSGLTSVTIGSSVKSIAGQAFGNCDELTDIYCMAEKLGNGEWSSEGLYTNIDAFKDSYPQYMTLHVPAASIEAYRSTAPWSQFKAIVALKDGDNPEIKICATPEISYANGKVSLSCETEGVEFISEVTVADAKKYYDPEFTLSQTYKITVYATKAGYENSDVATREIVVEKDQTTLFGDLNKDGKVNVADHVKLSDIIMNK